MPATNVIVIGGGLAGLAASVALAEHGMRVSLLERHPRLGGRATSYTLPTGECIDNCQHVTLRCCTNLEDFYRRIGVAHHIRYYDRLLFADSNGLQGEIRSSRLPAPLHLSRSFASFPLLKWSDKRAIARAMFRIVRSRGRVTAEPAITMLDWLKQNRQTQSAIDRFWRVVLVSALNEELDRMDALYGVSVFWKAFISNRDGFRMGVPVVPLETLYGAAGDRISRANGQVRTRCGVADLSLMNGKIAGVRLDDGAVVEAKYYVAAIPFDRLLKILPAEFRKQPPFADLAMLKVSPITSVHLWFDRPVMSEPFLTSVDQTIQWVFNKSNSSIHYLQIVISASHALTACSQADITKMCTDELGQLMPETTRAKLLRSVVVRESAATFSPEPGCDRWRPSQRTPFANFFLAGDWTQTGWPATMEGAVRSGYRAAESILATEGKPIQVLQPDLPAFW